MTKEQTEFERIDMKLDKLIALLADKQTASNETTTDEPQFASEEWHGWVTVDRELSPRASNILLKLLESIDFVAMLYYVRGNGARSMEAQDKLWDFFKSQPGVGKLTLLNLSEVFHITDPKR